MAIARIFDAPGWTPDQYDALIARMQLGGHSAPGVLFHWAAQTDTGMRAVDVYASRADADRLVQETDWPDPGGIGPAGTPDQRVRRAHYARPLSHSITKNPPPCE